MDVIIILNTFYKKRARCLLFKLVGVPEVRDPKRFALSASGDLDMILAAMFSGFDNVPPACSCFLCGMFDMWCLDTTFVVYDKLFAKHRCFTI